MAVKQILELAGNKMGIDPSGSQRTTLLRFLNEAAVELYEQNDPVGSLMEQVFKVNGNQEISLPANFGSLRAMREYFATIPWHINQMRPRYNQFNWTDMWRNWRVKNTQALQSTVTNESVGVITVPEVENPPIVVTVGGPTNHASYISESITMDSLSKSTTAAFNDYTLVSKDRSNNCDVTLSDVDGKVLTVIPNNRLDAKYQLIDVSECPFLTQDTGKQDNYVEVLFKKSLTYLSSDADEYPVLGYDYILVNKMLQLWAEEQGKADIAVGYDSKATRGLARKQYDQNKETEDEIALVANPHDTMAPRVSGGVRKRRWWFRGGRL